MVSEVHLVVPAGYDDPTRPSGGNLYDLNLNHGLAARGWTVHLHEIPHAWPTPDQVITKAVSRALGDVPADQVVLLDGLIATAAAAAMITHAPRLRLVLLVHMPE